MKEHWHRILMRQVAIAPVAMALPVVLTLFVPGFDPLAQHMSEYQLGPPWISATVRLAAIVAGLSICAFALGCTLRHDKVGWSWTALAAAAFGLAMVGNGLFIAGDPRHGLYGLAIFSVLVPAFFAVEFSDNLSAALRSFSLFTSFAGLLYMWMLLVGLDPPAYSGLTQRLATALSFGWFAVPAFLLSFRHPAPRR